MEKFIIKNGNGTYYRLETSIGPCFGGTLAEAEQFNTKEEASNQMMTHSFAFLDSIIETKEVYKIVVNNPQQDKN